MKTLSLKLKHIIQFLLIGGLINVFACNDNPRQQKGEATNIGQEQDEMVIDTTSNASFGVSGGDSISGGSPDLDTLEQIDKGVKTEDAFKDN